MMHTRIWFVTLLMYAAITTNLYAVSIDLSVGAQQQIYLGNNELKRKR